MIIKEPHVDVYSIIRGTSSISVYKEYKKSNQIQIGYYATIAPIENKVAWFDTDVPNTNYYYINIECGLVAVIANNRPQEDEKVEINCSTGFVCKVDLGNSTDDSTYKLLGKLYAIATYNSFLEFAKSRKLSLKDERMILPSDEDFYEGLKDGTYKEPTILNTSHSL